MIKNFENSSIGNDGLQENFNGIDSSDFILDKSLDILKNGIAPDWNKMAIVEYGKGGGGRRKDNKVEAMNKRTEVKNIGGETYAYKVVPGDTTQIINNKLASNPQFNYLKRGNYAGKGGGRNTSGFNIPNQYLKPGMWLIIPQSIESRQFEDGEFLKVCEKSIDNMRSNPIYGETITKLVNNIGQKNLARVMTAFAKVETAGGNPIVKIGSGGLYRYESTTRYSISYFHVLVEGVGQKVLGNLKMTIGEACDPVNSGMLFLGFWCECEDYAKRLGLSLDDCLNPSKSGWAKNAVRIYNSGSKSYPSALKTCYDCLKDEG